MTRTAIIEISTPKKAAGQGVAQAAGRRMGMKAALAAAARMLARRRDLYVPNA